MSELDKDRIYWFEVAFDEISRFARHFGKDDEIYILTEKELCVVAHHIGYKFSKTLEAERKGANTLRDKNTKRKASRNANFIDSFIIALMRIFLPKKWMQKQIEKRDWLR